MTDQIAPRFVGLPAIVDGSEAIATTPRRSSSRWPNGPRSPGAGWSRYTYDPRRGPTLAERLSLQGNPALKDDWASAPDGTPIDFLAFARTEGRFAPHFATDGSPTPEILATQADRLAGWRTLQELAGLRG